jgi:cell division control protein 6
MMPIIKNIEVLSPTYIPDDVVRRQKEIEEIWFNLQYLARPTPSPAYHMHLFGPKGTGKTVVTHYLLRRLKSKANPEKVAILYTPTFPTSFLTLSSLLAKLAGKPLTIRNSFYDYWTEFERNAEGKYLVVVLDDIDRLMVNQRDSLDLLFHLSRRDKTTIISISNKGWALDRLQDPKYSSIESSFKPAKIIFKPYDTNELFQILKARQPLAFYPNTCPDEVLLECAKIASYSGDARWALDILQHAAQIAENEGKSQISKEHVAVADNIVGHIQLHSKLTSLTRPELVYLKAVALTTSVEPRTGIRHEPLIAQVDKKFIQIAPEHGVNVYTARRLRQLREHLITEQLIKVFGGRGLGRGKGTEWYISLLEEDPQKLINEINAILCPIAYGVEIGEPTA